MLTNSGYLLSAGEDGIINLIDLEKKKIIKKIINNFKIKNIIEIAQPNFMMKYSYLIVSGESNVINVYDTIRY